MAQHVCTIVKIAPKRPFSLGTAQLYEAMDQSGIPLGLMLRPTSICQGAFVKFDTVDSTIRGNNQRTKSLILLTVANLLFDLREKLHKNSVAGVTTALLLTQSFISVMMILLECLFPKFRRVWKKRIMVQSGQNLAEKILPWLVVGQYHSQCLDHSELQSCCYLPDPNYCLRQLQSWRSLASVPSQRAFSRNRSGH